MAIRKEKKYNNEAKVTGLGTEHNSYLTELDQSIYVNELLFTCVVVYHIVWYCDQAYFIIRLLQSNARHRRSPMCTILSCPVYSMQGMRVGNRRTVFCIGSQCILLCQSTKGYTTINRSPEDRSFLQNVRSVDEVDSESFRWSLSRNIPRVSILIFFNIK